MKRVWAALKWLVTPEDYEANHRINKKPLVRTFESGLQGIFLVWWLFYILRDYLAHDTGQMVLHLIFLAHRIWCAWRWYKYLKNHDDDDDDDEGGHRRRVPLWRQVMMGA